MTIKVTQTSNNYSVKIKKELDFNVSVVPEANSVAASFGDLTDFNSNGVQNGYVIMYDSANQKYITVDPDEVLSKSVDGGLPNNFVNQLDVDLDNKIDLDAGTF